MSDKHIKLIKPTRDGKWWAMGLVVETLDEAFDRCDKKGRSLSYFIEEESLYPEFKLTAGLASSSREWLKECLI